jgi:hypothetical protein
MKKSFFGSLVAASVLALSAPAFAAKVVTSGPTVMVKSSTTASRGGTVGAVNNTQNINVGATKVMLPKSFSGKAKTDGGFISAGIKTNANRGGDIKNVTNKQKINVGNTLVEVQ